MTVLQGLTVTCHHDLDFQSGPWYLCSNQPTKYQSSMRSKFLQEKVWPESVQSYICSLDRLWRRVKIQVPCFQLFQKIACISNIFPSSSPIDNHSLLVYICPPNITLNCSSVQNNSSGTWRVGVRISPPFSNICIPNIKVCAGWEGRQLSRFLSTLRKCSWVHIWQSYPTSIIFRKKQIHGLFSVLGVIFAY